MKKLTAVISTILCLLPTILQADQLENHTIVCKFDDNYIIMRIPMPRGLSNESREKIGKSVCNSMIDSPITNTELTTQTDNKTPKDAICDTDYNCEVLWEKYNKFNINSIFTAPSSRQRKGVNVLEITCKGDDPITHYTATEAELPSICQTTTDILDTMESDAKADGSTDEFSLNWYRLEAAVEANMIPTNRSSNNSPTTTKFLEFMKKHPEAEVLGIYRNDQGAKKACELLNKPQDKNEQCYKDNYGIIISELVIRFGEGDDLPIWLKDFCADAKNIDKYTDGFWHCNW